MTQACVDTQERAAVLRSAHVHARLNDTGAERPCALCLGLTGVVDVVRRDEKGIPDFACHVAGHATKRGALPDRTRPWALSVLGALRCSAVSHSVLVHARHDPESERERASVSEPDCHEAGCEQTRKVCERVS